VLGPLPDFWVVSFVAALLVVAGQAMYQLWAPELVKRSTSAEYASERRREFAENPSDGMVQEALGRITSVRDAEELAVRGEKARRLPRGVSRLVARLEPSELEILGGLSGGTWIDREGALARLDVIEVGARVEYAFAASRYWPWALAAFATYSAVVFLIIYLAGSQLLAVMKAAEWF
jgi:hypothetical protein